MCRPIDSTVNDPAAAPASAAPLTRRGVLGLGLRLAAAAAVGAVAGCRSNANPGGASADAGQSTTPTDMPRSTDPVAPISNTDPCATRLHELCGPLLLFFQSRQRLPDRIEELREIRGFENLEITCPVSNRPYVCRPIGIATGDGQPRIVIFDPAPSHSGFRWAVTIIEPTEDRPRAPITKVIALPESAFTLKPTR